MKEENETRVKSDNQVIIELVSRIRNKKFDERELNELIGKFGKKPLFIQSTVNENLNESLMNKLGEYGMDEDL